ncbi:hypothetical protein [Coleofasciculus sp. FACHB-542]|uniref:hypothetical protein n=1 Tax=Coleofasciculus sp. FACHB-542 TaxID=2692787 RepID=UPI001684B867|nr:hypothetical protein [Coleofasciculus sp. FACHB-542]MBD2087620.1 hypothetical protein [Coleofasciculus sp. FACHB-542]
MYPSYFKPQSSNLSPQSSNLSPQSSNLSPQSSNLSPQSSNLSPLSIDNSQLAGNLVMAASDKFKQQLKAGKIVEALSTALSETIELEITTWVSSTDIDDRTSEEQPQPGSRMQTRINIVEGDITNEIGDRFLNSGPYSELRQFHLEQVQQSRAIINDNLKSLQKLFGMLVRVGYQNPKAAPIPPDKSRVDPRLPPDETAASIVTIEPEVLLVEGSPTDAIAFDPRVEIDTVPAIAPTPSVTPDFLPPATPETPVEPAVSAQEWEEAVIQEPPFQPGWTPEFGSALPPDFLPPATPETSVEPAVSAQGEETVIQEPPFQPGWTPEFGSALPPDFLPPATPQTPVEPAVSAQEWEEAVIQEPPFETGWRPEFGSAVNWGTEEEWEEVEVEEEPTHPFSARFAPVEDEVWNENDDGWEEDEEPSTTPDISNPSGISDPIAVLFGDTPVEPSQPSPPMSDTRSPVNIEEALFSQTPPSQTPPKPFDEFDEFEEDDEFDNPSPPPPSK